jgi:hypothetical protein
MAVPLLLYGSRQKNLVKNNNNITKIQATDLKRDTWTPKLEIISTIGIKYLFHEWNNRKLQM